MKLLHFSEESSITKFVPRVKENRRDMPPVVWAIDEAHEHTFYFPRECPRIFYTRTDDLTEEDRIRFFGQTTTRMVATVEKDWYQRIRNATIYRYTFPGESFELFDECAGYYISQETVTPLCVEPLDRLLDRLMELDIEVRFTSSLYPLKEAILNSSISNFGMHKFHNTRHTDTQKSADI